MKTIKSFLAERRNKKEILKFVHYIGENQKKFDELISFCFGKDVKLAQHAAWPLGYCAEKHPNLAKKHIRRMIKQISHLGHPAIRRSFLKIFEYAEIPASEEAKLISECFQFINRKEEFVAVKVFAMSVIARYCKKYPELWPELKSSIELQIPFETAAFHSRAKRILKLYQKSLNSLD